MVHEYLNGNKAFYSDAQTEYYMRYTLDALVLYRVNRSTNEPTDIYLLDGDRNLDPCGGSRFYPETQAMYGALIETLLLKLDIAFFVRGWVQYTAHIDNGNIIVTARESREARHLASFIVQENNYWKTVFWNIRSVEEDALLKDLTTKAQKAFVAEVTRRHRNA